MRSIRRRRLLQLSATAAALPRFAIAAGNDRPVVTVAVQAIVTSNTLDPLAEQSNVGERILNSYVETLIGRNLQGELQSVPALATGWKRISDSVVEVALRRGVKFHNGDEMTAEDVAFTFGPERMFGTTQPAGMGKTLAMNTARPVDSGKQLPPQVPPVARRLWPSLERVEIVDKYTVRFINATPDVTLEGRMTAMGSQIINRRAFEAAPTWLAYARQPIGTGPYKVRSFSPQNELILDAHDDYWGGRPPIQTLRFVEVPEVSQRLNGLRAGQYHFACDLSPDQIRTVDAEPRLQVAGGVIPNIRFSIFDKYDTALKDPRVRQAMTHAIDRQAIVRDLWDGRTIIPAGLQFPFYGPMFVKRWTVPKYDPALARSLLKQAGYKGDPIPYRLLNDYYTDQTSTAQIITEMWKQVGLNVVIEMKENWAQIFTRDGIRGLNDWSNSALFNDPVSSLVTQHGPQGQQQQVGMWTNAEFNQLCGTLVSGTDMAKRHQVFARMLEICEREDPAYNVLHQNATFTGKLKSILWKPAPDFAMDFRATNWGGSGPAAQPAARLIDICGLRVAFGGMEVVRGLDFSIGPGEAVGLVGESGSGKSVTWLAVTRLLGPAAEISGSVMLAGEDVLRASPARMDHIRGRRIAMIFQDPASALNPVRRVGKQVSEALRLHRGMDAAAARAETIRLFDLVGLPDAAWRFSAYPHELSGGQNQRVMIAMALSGRPDLLVADEPTTALDATIQAQILDLLDRLRAEFGMALLLITHDLGVVSRLCDRIAVMYAGTIVEAAPAGRLFRGAAHPYTRGLLGASPPLHGPRRRLTAIPGRVPEPFDMPPGCPFAPRCPEAETACTHARPTLAPCAPDHVAACLHVPSSNRVTAHEPA